MIIEIYNHPELQLVVDPPMFHPDSIVSIDTTMGLVRLIDDGVIVTRPLKLMIDINARTGAPERITVTP